MKNDLYIKNGVTIPEHELTITASRAGGPGGQNVNKVSTRITIRWNVKTTQSLTDTQKERVLKNLESKLTSEGDLIVHNGSTRSQLQNKKLALDQLAEHVRSALYVKKKRKKTKISKNLQEKRLQEKKQRSMLKKLRRARGQ